jgi:small subunit ribosomal protein S9
MADNDDTQARGDAQAPDQETAAESAEPPAEAPVEPVAEEPTESPAKPVAEEPAESPADAPVEPVAEAPADGEASAPAEPVAEASADGEASAPAEPVAEASEEAAAEAPAEPAEPVEEPVARDEDESDEEPAPRVKPSVPGAHLEVDIVPEGVDPLGRGEEYVDTYAIEDEEEAGAEAAEDTDRQDEVLSEPIATAAIDLAAGARYRATGKRKTAIARVTLRPGNGTYLVNGRSLEEHFPRATLQRNIRQPLETVGYQERMDVVARLHGGGISAQAGALRHGVSRALLEADPNLRGELKRRGFLTRDSRAKERKKAGLKKARKRPQFSKR